jgi:hypothetical protein
METRFDKWLQLLDADKETIEKELPKLLNGEGTDWPTLIHRTLELQSLNPGINVLEFSYLLGLEYVDRLLEKE